MNKKEATIIKWILILPIIGVILTSFLLTNIFISSKKNSHDREIEYLENNHVENLKEKIKERIETLSILLTNDYTNRFEALNFIEKLKFNDDSYVFVIDENKTTLVHKNKMITNIPFDELNDLKIKENITKIVTTAIKDGNTFIEYKQSEKIFKDFKQSKKISYIKYLPTYNFVIGTGLYTNDLQNDIKRIDKNLADKLVDDIKDIVLISLLITFGVIIFMLYLSKKLKNIFDFYAQRHEESNKNLLHLNNQLENKVQEQLSLLREKDLALNQQSKMAAMGEMLGNIAHQWRQPLSAISTIASGIKLKKELDNLNDNELDEDLENIVQTTIVLSNTIDDFRNLYSRDKEEKEFLINNTIQKVLNLISANLKNKDIHVIANMNDVKLFSYENELIQILLNIINNAKDALVNKIGEKYIFIDCYEENGKAVIKIYDNAGGINEEILPRIYEPYFTTKFKSQGTGIGLYMSKNVLETNLRGEIFTSNINFNYENKEYAGALFELRIPIK